MVSHGDLRSNMPQSFNASRISFIADKTGEPESLFKAELSRRLSKIRHVKEAYLAVISANDSSSVAICFMNERREPDYDLVALTGEIFKTIFSYREHLDIMFLTEVQGREIKLVCSPFYSSAA